MPPFSLMKGAHHFRMILCGVEDASGCVKSTLAGALETEIKGGLRTSSRENSSLTQAHCSPLGLGLMILSSWSLMSRLSVQLQMHCFHIFLKREVTRWKRRKASCFGSAATDSIQLRREDNVLGEGRREETHPLLLFEGCRPPGQGLIQVVKGGTGFDAVLLG